MTTHFPGGRGKKAPYQSSHVRIPTAIKKDVEFLTKAYKEAVSTNNLDSYFDIIAVMKNSTEEVKYLKKQIDTLTQTVESLYSDQEYQARLIFDNILPVLKNSLTLKANAGGKIKEEIRKVIELIKGWF